MKVILCVDDNLGMLFNNRRQSRDRVLTEDVLSLAANDNLYINDFSAELFAGSKAIVDNSFMEKNPDGYCFIENVDIVPYLSKIETLVIYRWNRTYPYDFKLNTDLAGFSLSETKEFKGSSHEKITRQIYTRR